MEETGKPSFEPPYLKDVVIPGTRNKVDVISLIGKVNFSTLYVDSGGYTVPVLMTQERYDKIIDDRSVLKIKITLKDAELELDVI